MMRRIGFHRYEPGTYMYVLCVNCTHLCTSIFCRFIHVAQFQGYDVDANIHIIRNNFEIVSCASRSCGGCGWVDSCRFVGTPDGAVTIGTDNREGELLLHDKAGHMVAAASEAATIDTANCIANCLQK